MPAPIQPNKPSWFFKQENHMRSKDLHGPVLAYCCYYSCQAVRLTIGLRTSPLAEPTTPRTLTGPAVARYGFMMRRAALTLPYNRQRLLRSPKAILNQASDSRVPNL